MCFLPITVFWHIFAFNLYNPMDKIAFLDLKRVNLRCQKQIDEAIDRVVHSNRYLFGNETKSFENEYSTYIGTKHCVTCANGLDALTLIYKALIALGRMHEGDEVLVPANTYIASILAISECKLKPVLVEPDSATLQISEETLVQAITPRCKSLMIVHLYGRCAYSKHIADICKSHDLLLVEDNAQAHGCCYIDEKGYHKTGSLSMAAGHSFYPTKNLGALGDAGAVTTNDQELAFTIRALANYGSDRRYHNIFLGRNSRMDELQAAVLRAKLLFLDKENKVRQRLAEYYYQYLNPILFILPKKPDSENHVYHLFPILLNEEVERDRWRSQLTRMGVDTDVHYPTSPHRQPCYANEFNNMQFPVTDKIHRSIVSLPLFPGMTDEELSFITQQVNALNTTYS